MLAAPTNLTVASPVLPSLLIPIDYLTAISLAIAQLNVADLALNDEWAFSNMEDVVAESPEFAPVPRSDFAGLVRRIRKPNQDVKFACNRSRVA